MNNVATTLAPLPLSAESIPELNSADRCDACGARAFVRVRLESGELFFCAHHAHKYHDTLNNVSEVVRDDREKLDLESK